MALEEIPFPLLCMRPMMAMGFEELENVGGRLSALSSGGEIDDVEVRRRRTSVSESVGHVV